MTSFRFRFREGNVAGAFAIASILLVTAVGFAVDYSRVRVARSELQKYLDAALSAAAQEHESVRVELAEVLFDTMTTGSIGNSVHRSFKDEDGGLSGIATAAVPTTLSGVLGFKSIDISASGHADTAD